MFQKFSRIFNFFNTPESQQVSGVIKKTFINFPMILILFLSFILFLEALWAVHQKVHARSLDIQYFQLIAQQQSINAQWTQLLIEQGTWGSSAYIEQAAQNYLNMQFPKAQDTRIVQLIEE